MCNFVLISNIDCDFESKDLEKYTSRLISLCLSIDTELLFSKIYSICSKDNKPILVEILAFYAYQYFNSVNDTTYCISSVIIKKYLTLLNGIFFHRKNDSTINEYIRNVRGLSYAHQIQEKIIKLGPFLEDEFIKKIGMTPGRFVEVVRNIYMILSATESSEDFFFISKEEVERWQICTEEEWDVLIKRFALTKENAKSLVNIDSVRERTIYALRDKYLFSTPHHFLDIAWERFQSGIEKCKNFEKYNRERNSYSEERLHEILIRVFPKECIRAKQKYNHLGSKKSSEKSEIDAIILWHGTMIVLEQKAGRFFRPLTQEKRGQDNFVNERLRPILQYSYQQASDFIKFFRSSDRLKVMQTLKIDGLLNNYRIITCTVTMDTLANFGFNTELLIEQHYGPIREVNDIIISLDELEIIADHCVDRPSFFIDYMTQRISMNFEKPYVSDELDLFGFYVDKGYLPKSLPDTNLYVSGFSDQFDLFYIVKYLR